MTFRLNRAVLGAMTVWLSAAPAAAEGLGDLARETEDAVAAGRTVEALELAGRFAAAVRDAAPLAFRKTVLVEREPAAFGADTPRASSVYGVDEEIHIYAEPVAFGWRPAGEGFETDMVADVRLADADGRIIVGHKAFSEFNIAAKSRDADVFLAMTYVFGGLGAGDYVVTTTLHDRVTGKAASFSTPFSVR